MILCIIELYKFYQHSLFTLPPISNKFNIRENYVTAKSKKTVFYDMR
jgi:hypothetical protein